MLWISVIANASAVTIPDAATAPALVRPDAADVTAMKAGWSRSDSVSGSMATATGTISGSHHGDGAVMVSVSVDTGL